MINDDDAEVWIEESKLKWLKLNVVKWKNDTSGISSFLNFNNLSESEQTGLSPKTFLFFINQISIKWNSKQKENQ